MIFRRTSNGLSNQRLFFKVDAFVFVEGGQGFTKAEALAGKFDTDSIDVQFWKGIFTIFCNNQRLQYRAIGSKETLKDIAKDIQTGEIENSYVAMDRDFDLQKNKKLNCNGVIYTYGYSWENDVWQVDVLEDVLKSICSTDFNGNDIKDEILQIYNDFIKDIKLGVCADVLLSLSDQSFFDRAKHLRYLEFGKKIKPKVNLERIKSELQECQLSEQEIIDFADKNDIQAHEDCLGHLMSDFFYWITVYLTNKLTKLPSLAKHYFNCIGIDKFIVKLSDKHFHEIFSHYDKSFALPY